MKRGKLHLLLAALPMLFAGCDALDIFKADSLEAPHVKLTGRVMFNGEPVPVRAPNATQLRVWHTSWEAGDTLRQPTSMGIHLNADGQYSAMIYDGTYEIQLIENQGPWVNDTTRIPFTVTGDSMAIDVPVQPYYTIENEPSYVYTPPAAGDTTGGRITATFKVDQHVTTPAIDLVGLYINTTMFVDRTKRETTLRGSWTYPLVAPPAANPTPAGQNAGSPHERVRTQVQTQLNADQPISITLILPSTVRTSLNNPGPTPRTKLYARVGVKAVNWTELAYSKVVPIDISLP